MEVFRNDVKAGLFIVVGGLLFLYTLFRVGGMLDTLSDGLDVSLHFANAQQVEEGAEIYFRGLKVGRVRAVTLNEDGEGVVMSARLDNELALFEGTTAQVADKSLLGGKMIELQSAASSTLSKPKRLTDGAVIEGLPAGGIDAMLDSVNEMISAYRGRIDTLLTKVDNLLDRLTETAEETTKGIRSFAGTEQKLTNTLDAYKELAQNLELQIAALLKDVSTLLATTEDKIGNVDTQFKTLTTRLETQMTEVTTRLNTLLENSNKLVGTSDLVLGENRAALHESLTTLQKTLVHLESFSAQIAQRPSSLVWKGRKKKHAAKQ